MFIFKYALRNILRNIRRSILIGIIVLFIVTTAVISLIIINSSDRIIDSYKAQFDVKVSISPDVDKMMNDNNDLGIAPFSPLTLEQYLSFSQSKYLQKSTFSTDVPCVGEELKAVEQSKNSGVGKIFNAAGNESMVSPTLELIGNSGADDVSDIYDEKRKIIEGKMYHSKNECIISKDLADLNNVSVGDMITVKSTAEKDETLYKLTVTGIYIDTASEYGNIPSKNSYTDRRNEILTGLQTIAYSDTGIDIQAAYYLKSKDLLPEFDAELKAKGLPDYYSVGMDKAGFNKKVGPLQGLRIISLIIMIIALILGTVIIVLISSIFIKRRRNEVETLRIMGMKRKKIVLGMVLETLVITLICFLAGLGIGTASAQSITNVLLKDQVNAVIVQSQGTLVQRSKSQNGSTGSRQIVYKVLKNGEQLIENGQNSSNISPVDKLNVGLESNTLWQILAISLMLAAAASVTVINRIYKYEPVKIFSERS